MKVLIKFFEKNITQKLENLCDLIKKGHTDAQNGTQKCSEHTFMVHQFNKEILIKNEKK